MHWLNVLVFNACVVCKICFRQHRYDIHQHFKMLALKFSVLLLRKLNKSALNSCTEVNALFVSIYNKSDRWG